jgi:hypothetical protein
MFGNQRQHTRLPGRASVSLGSRLSAIWSAFFPTPTAEDALFCALAKRPPRRILEIGLGDGSRALRIIKLAKRRRRAEVHYVGVDPFELRPRGESPRLTLKSAYRLLRAAGAHVKLVPGDPFAALARTANTINQIDAVIIGHDADTHALARAWFYVPRMLAPGAVVYWADNPAQPDEYREVSLVEVFQRAAVRRQHQRVRQAA